MTTPATATCTLPGGYLVGDHCHREAVLRPLTGRQEELLTSVQGPPAEQITQVLADCVERIGPVDEITPDAMRRLLVADRQYLLLQLRTLSYGDRVQGTLGCPWTGCGARVDIEFSIDDVPVKRTGPIRPAYTVDLPREAADGRDASTVAFRLPNGGDQEAAAPLVEQNAARALTVLLERCLQPPSDLPADEFVAGLSPRARALIEAAMEEHAPAVELDMDVTCPECERAFTAPFDVQDFFLGELRSSRDLLHRQVHYLAYHYHWSEGEILDMPREKRHTYIEILAEEIDAMNAPQ
jgi:hypothetical protein